MKTTIDYAMSLLTDPATKVALGYPIKETERETGKSNGLWTLKSWKTTIRMCQNSNFEVNYRFKFTEKSIQSVWFQ